MYAVAMTGEEVEDFRDHEYSYERVHQIGLFEEKTATAWEICIVKTEPRAITVEESLLIIRQRQ